MVVRVFLRGGLGNQFFQWMHARQLASQGHDVVLDISFLRRKVGNQASGGLELQDLLGDLRHSIVRTPQLWRVERVFSRVARWCGLLQSDRPRPITERIAPLQYGYFQKPLTVCPALHQARAALRADLREREAGLAPYAAIHLRIGDYQHSHYNRTQLGILDSSYYRRALTALRAQGLQRWLVVSDDYTAARALVEPLRQQADPPLCYLDEKLGGRDTPSQALRALMHAQVLVCANSSFSAMAGYLGQAQTIYAPQPWFRGVKIADLDPSAAGWKRISASFQNLK